MHLQHLRSFKRMKRIIIYLFIILIFSCKSNHKLNDGVKKVDKLYYLSKIDSVGQVYLFYFKRNDTIYKVMSKKRDVNKCTELKKGNKYNLILDSWFLPEEFHVRMRVSGITFNNELIRLERDSIISNLYTSENIKDKCYMTFAFSKIK